MKTIAPRQDQGIPGVYGLLLLDVISRWGHNNESLFQPFGLTSEQLADPDFRIPTLVANELVKYALKLTGELNLGSHLGTPMRISIHGFIGYAIMTANILPMRWYWRTDLFNSVYPSCNYFSRLLVPKPRYSCKPIVSLNLCAPKLPLP